MSEVYVEVECDNCNGTGWAGEGLDAVPQTVGGFPNPCKQCNGSGKVGWYEQEPNHEEGK